MSVELVIIPITVDGGEPWRYLGVVSGPGIFRVRRALCPLRLARWGITVRLYAARGLFRGSDATMVAGAEVQT